MKKVPFILQRPTWVQNDASDDNVAFYNNIEKVLRSWGNPCKVTLVTKHVYGQPVPKNYKGIFLAYHTSYTSDNLWNLKKGYVPHFMNFDRNGFSGWSELAKNESLFNDSQLMDADKSTEYVNTFVSKYAAKNISKYVQSNTPFNMDKPFLFVACQRPLDIVSSLARIGTYELAEQVVNALSDKINIVVKLHPKEIYSEELDHLKGHPNVYFTDASIHELIPKSSGVITVNSGVGFEALLYGKHVFTSGEADYHWVTHKLSNNTDIADIINKIKTLPDLNKINKFLFYMMTKHFMQANNLESVKDHLQRAIDDYSK